MERIDDVDMVATMTKRPWTIARQGRALDNLHRRLHELATPDWMRDSPVGQGNRLVHLNLHPLNVMIGPPRPDCHRLDKCLVGSFRRSFDMAEVTMLAVVTKTESVAGP